MFALTICNCFVTDGEDEDDGEYDEEDEDESENGDPSLADIYNDGNYSAKNLVECARKKNEQLAKFRC